MRGTCWRSCKCAYMRACSHHSWLRPSTKLTKLGSTSFVLRKVLHHLHHRVISAAVGADHVPARHDVDPNFLKKVNFWRTSVFRQLSSQWHCSLVVVWAGLPIEDQFGRWHGGGLARPTMTSFGTYVCRSFRISICPPLPL